MCHFKTSFTAPQDFAELPEVLNRLSEMKHDGLININSNTIEVTKKGQPFVRNICMAFDLLLQRKQPDTQLFSMTV
jgi:oxygen-independent coproporphyrinogen-3 oxidase